MDQPTATMPPPTDPGTTGPRRMHRSSRERMLTGVSGGLAEYFDVDATVIRLAWVIAGFVTGPIAVAAYIAFAMVMPSDDRPRGV